MDVGLSNSSFRDIYQDRLMIDSLINGINDTSIFYDLKKLKEEVVNKEIFSTLENHIRQLRENASQNRTLDEDLIQKVEWQAAILLTDLAKVAKYNTIFKDVVRQVVENQCKAQCVKEKGKELLASIESPMTLRLLDALDVAYPAIITQEEIEVFIKRGGKIKLLQERESLDLDRSREYIVGCNQGVHFSQVLYRYLVDKGLKLALPPVAVSCGLNPNVEMGYFENLDRKDREWNRNFKEATGHVKVPQFGYSELSGESEEEIVGGELDEAKKFYQDKVNALADSTVPLTIISFIGTGESFLARLLKTQKPLNYIEIIFCSIREDNPQDCNYSKEDYQAFYKKMEKAFIIKQSV